MKRKGKGKRYTEPIVVRREHLNEKYKEKNDCKIQE